MRAKVYIETSIPSYLTARPCNDLRVMANQSITIEWWEFRRHAFDIYISEFVLVEASRGDTDAAARRAGVLRGIPELEVTESVRVLAEALISKGAIPMNAEVDAYHVAVATIHGMDYLLTWNCAHIANAAIRPRVEDVCRNQRYEPPVICTPQELMEN